MSTASFIRASAAAATLGTLIAGSALFALPAAADTNGYQSGYQYVQGLAIGDGAMLMSEAGSGAAASSNAGVSSVGTGVTTNTVPTTETTPAVQSQTSVAPAANTQTAVAPAAAPAAAPATGMSGAMIAGWAALGLAVILILAAIWSFFAQERVSRTRRTTTVYQ